MSRFTFLGTGTSAGVPAIACSCRVCTSSDSRDKRLRAGAMLRVKDAKGQERVILIDATPDLRQQALTHNVQRCDAILFTHNHVDHTFGLDDVRRFNAVMKAPIDIYAEPHTMGFLKRVYQHVFEKDANINDSFVAHLIPWTIMPNEPINLFGLRITPLRLLHGKLPIVGFRFDTFGHQAQSCDETFPLAYCTDVSAIPPETYPSLQNLRTLVLDGLRHRSHPTHLTIEQAIEISQSVRPDQTFLTHIAHDVLHAETDESLPPSIKLAYDGLTLV